MPERQSGKAWQKAPAAARAVRKETEATQKDTEAAASDSRTCDVRMVPESGDDIRVDDLSGLIMDAARERLCVPPGKPFGIADMARVGMLDNETGAPPGLVPGPVCPGSESRERARMLESLWYMHHMPRHGTDGGRRSCPAVQGQDVTSTGHI